MGTEFYVTIHSLYYFYKGDNICSRAFQVSKDDFGAERNVRAPEWAVRTNREAKCGRMYIGALVENLKCE